MEHNLKLKNSEIRMLKDHNVITKKTFDSKVTQLRKGFNSKLVELSKNVYPNFNSNESILLKESVASNRNNETHFGNSVLRVSQLVSSKNTAYYTDG